MKVLLLAHGFPPGAVGGTEIYTHDLARTLAARFGDEVTVLAREADHTRPEFAVRRDDRADLRVVLINNTFGHVRTFEDTYRCEPIRRACVRVLEEARPDIVHVQHLTGLSTNVIAECAWRRIPTVVTLNDFWLLCHRGQLLDVDLRPCPGPLPDGCDRCLGAGVGATPSRGGVTRLRALGPAVFRSLGRRVTAADRGSVGFDAGRRAMQARVAHVRWVSSLTTLFLAPSRTLRSRFLQLGIPEDRILLQEQGIDVRPFLSLRRRGGDHLRIGFMGSLIASKAPHLALEALADLPAGAAELHLYGAYAPYHGDDSYRQVLAPLLARPGVHHHGPVPHTQVPQVLASIDVLVVPSVWLENAPFVIREAYAAGVPVIASNHGGTAEMVTDGGSGLLFRPGDARALARALRRLLQEPRLLDTLRGGIPPVRTIEEDAAWTREVYRRSGAQAEAGNRSRMTAPPTLAAVVRGDGDAESTVLTVRSLQASRRPIDELVVVDAGCDEQTARHLRTALAGVALLQTEGSLEAPGGVTGGIRASLDRGAELVFVVDSGTIVPPGSLERLEEALSSMPGAGIAGPVIVSRSDPERVISAGVAVSRATGRMRHHGEGRLVATVDPPPVRTVNAVSGSAMLVRRAVFERAGVLADARSVDSEEVAFCLRARRAGFSTVCVGPARVHQERSRSRPAIR